MEELIKALESINPSIDKDGLDKRFLEIAAFLMKNYGFEAHGKVYL